MKDEKAIQLLLNEERQDHGQVVAKLLKQAERLECLVAFAKTSALNDMMKELEKALIRGLKARFAIGLDFYLTEPDLLRKLRKLGKDHALELYLSDSSETFHPKIYAFQSREHCSVLVGSANLTHGGLSRNYEASALISDANGALMASVIQHFDELAADEVIVPATETRIDAYERAYVVHDAWRKVAKKRAEKLNPTDEPSDKLLRDILELMKEDDSAAGFDAQKTLRRNKRRQARDMLENLTSQRGGVKRNFSQRYEALIGLFHSGGLHRGKTRVAEHPDQFLAAVVDIVGKRNLSPNDAFDVLHGHFSEIPGAGINLLTEILHALDNKRFAVMNQNAVSGMMRAGIADYPLHPTKQNVGGGSYARYCHQADGIRRALGLVDFTELDALFNYAYWGQAAGDD
ncbi:phospholipase D-like domain-containing protein [Ralstonia solanacearum]|uniref:phospholipase D-like domain-containing protein n=1 Tax=Ralstonia solanacearum TaxID=305 RepID=UPI0001D9595D|nr:phospholipase D-like domain-containing protein [Ralstonia solanacearum]CBJ50463.1 hypothethical protein [Ralstonia solanacearum PSI07]